MKSLEAWKNSVLGKTIDLDNQSFDCVDVSKHWVEYLTGVKWQTSAGWGNAKDIYAYWSNTYLDKLPAGSAPRLGDIAVMDGSVGGGYGHTGVVIAINGNNITLAQQNTFTQQPVYTGLFNAYGSYIKYMRPKTAFSVGDVPSVAPDERIPAYAAKYRTAANSGAPLMKTSTIPDGLLTAGETYKFKGYVEGESVDGNNKWLVGFYSGGYVWSGAMTDVGLHDLPNLTPASLKGNERQVGSDVMNVRREPILMPDNVQTTLQPGEVKAFEGWKAGTAVEGNNVWFKLVGSGYVWSGGFADSGTHDLPEIKDSTPTQPVPVEYPVPTNDPLVTKVYNKKNPVGDYEPTDLITFNGGQSMRKEAAAAMSLMAKAAAAEGVTFGMGSGYRSKATQKTLYENYVKQDGQEAADRYSARPGFSEHQIGLTMDFTPIDESFEIGNGFKWLQKNAHKFGFVLRYPKGDESITGYMYEPWHWRYIGVDAATDMFNKGERTLEQYYGVVGGNYNKPTEPADPENPDDPVIVQPTPDPETPAVKTEIKTVIVNMIVTFVQAFGGTWAATGFQLDKVVLSGAVGAALSLVWNTVLKPFLITKGILKK